MSQVMFRSVGSRNVKRVDLQDLSVYINENGAVDRNGISEGHLGNNTIPGLFRLSQPLAFLPEKCTREYKGVHFKEQQKTFL